MKKLILLTILFLVLGGEYIAYKSFLNQEIKLENFEVKKGDTAYKIKNKLCSENVIRDCINFDFYIYLNKPSKLIPGVYNFSGENIIDIFKQFSKGPKIKYKKFTILPGWTKFDIAKKLGNKNGEIFLNLVDDKKFISKLKNKFSFLNDFGNISSLEGFLYPDTYYFKKEDLQSSLFPQLLIKTAIKNFGKKWGETKCKDCDFYKLTNYQILILASIIEKEGKYKKNKAMIADILIRRFKNNWKLGADWTLCYGLKIDSKDCKYYLYNKYLKDNTNIYNTRARKGLPPTPVGNPTIESINAVIYPKKNNYWYYLHGKDGQIHYGKNSNEHILNKNRYIGN